MYMLNICSLHIAEFIQTYYHYIHLLLIKRPPYTSHGLILVSIFILHLYMLKLHFHTQWHSDTLQCNNIHIIYYHMDTTQSVGLAWTFFTHPDYLVIQVVIHATCSYLDTINKTGPHVYHCVTSFPGVGYTPLGTPCDCIMDIVNHSDALWPFIVTIYSDL